MDPTISRRQLGVDPLVRRLRSLLLRRAVDVTEEQLGTDTLVLAPHPDDRRVWRDDRVVARSGHRVVVVVVTDGRSSHESSVLGPDRLAARRAEEVRSAVEQLGVAPGTSTCSGSTIGASRRIVRRCSVASRR
ncbi:MAG: PIG-L family deacetylase [Ilumatobacteraceae bacterium]